MKTAQISHRQLRPGARALSCVAVVLGTFALGAQAQLTPSDRGTGATSSGGMMGASRSDYTRQDAYSLLPYTRRGYVGLNLGRAEFDLPCGAGGYECDDPNVSGYLYTGGLVNEWVGVELGYLNTGNADRAGGRTRGQGLNLSVVLRAPFGPFNVFGKLGGLYGETRVSAGPLSDVATGTERGWGGSYGLGAGFDFTPNHGVVLEWARHELKFPGQGRENVDSMNAGYVYRF